MKKVTKNLIWGFLGQFLILAMSIILPRFILLSFGSEVNGITNTITQIFVYIALLEAGIGNASVVRLYKELSENNKNEISATVSATKKYFNKIIPIYVSCVVIFCTVYPWLISTEVPSYTIRLIIAIQGLSGVINFYFTNTYTQLLIADGRNYVSSNLELMVKAVSTSLQILLISLGFDVVSVQIALLIANIIKALLVCFYVKKRYSWLKKEPQADIKRLEQRGSFIVHEVSGVIFQGTDIFLISIFCSIKEVSVYSIYSMVFVALSGIFSILFKGIDFKLGMEYHRDRDSYIKMHDTYETFMSTFVFATISAVMVVVLPFVALYTDGINDVNYIVPILPFLFGLIQILSSVRSVASKLINVSGHARKTIPNSLAETLINIIASIVMVNFFGMPGVLLGTIIALLYRTNDMIFYANIKILKRAPWYTYKTLLINILIFCVFLFLTNQLSLHINSYISFFVHGVVTVIVTFFVYFGVLFIFDKNIHDLLVLLIKKIKNRRRSV